MQHEEEGLTGLISRCLDGDRDAQQELYERHYRSVYRLAVRMVGRDVADDVTQDVFVRIFRGLHGFREDSAFSTWVHRISVNECLRQRSRDRQVSSTSIHEEPTDSIDSTKEPGQQFEQAELLESALAKLDAQLRAVFLLRESEGLSYDEIAAVLEIVPGTVASQLNRAKGRLREILKQM